MRRESLTLTVSGVSWVEDGSDPRRPTLTVAFDGDPAALEAQLRDGVGDPLHAGSIDLAVRLHGLPDDPDARGVVAVADRVTGDYALEVDTVAADLLAFLEAARRFGEQTGEAERYHVRFVADGETVARYEKETLLVYGPDGQLLRQHSLIPNGVEI